MWIKKIYTELTILLSEWFSLSRTFLVVSLAFPKFGYKQVYTHIFPVYLRQQEDWSVNLACNTVSFNLPQVFSSQRRHLLSWVSVGQTLQAYYEIWVNAFPPAANSLVARVHLKNDGFVLRCPQNVSRKGLDNYRMFILQKFPEVNCPALWKIAPWDVWTCPLCSRYVSWPRKLLDLNE